ncbi:endonuclease domain-containing protein, partial [Intestinibacter sp.]|uniref:endonuclease domain-containing protein n=1 Tax=Intestinibacter sp. TaxID=1965304 RepID=UPI002A914B10
MERYTAGYSYTNFNFVIQNLKMKKDIKNKYYPFICILKNILQRGVPTIMSTYLTYKIGKINLDNKQIIGLIDYEVPNWINTIKGDNVNNYYPAKQFFYEIIPQYLKEYKFIQQLMLPEAEIKDIVGEENKEFINQKVDFYLEPCKLVIEIDGLQHESELQLQIDSQRDEYLSKFGVKTIRINTTQIKSK